MRQMKICLLFVSTAAVLSGPANASPQQPPDVVHSDPQNDTAMGANALSVNDTAAGAHDNTAAGASTLISNSGGYANTALGSNALVGNTAGYENTASGYGALYRNSVGTDNTAIGVSALNQNTIGIFNTAVGASALKVNTEGEYNVAVGAGALENNTNGTNVAVGFQALFSNTSGDANIAVGTQALNYNSTGEFNSALGDFALLQNTSGTNNTAVGAAALVTNSTGNYNTASGVEALWTNSTGNYNAALGVYALRSNDTGGGNTASGYDALLENTTGNNNTALGRAALSANTHGSANIAVGFQAGAKLTTGNYNIDIGALGVAGEAGVIRIGTPGTQTSAFIAGIKSMSGGAAVLVNTSTGQLGFASSSQRYKQDIESMGDSSDRLFNLRPVKFRYKQPDAQGDKPVQFGLIAEEVAKAFPELVLTNSKGQPETVAYHLLPALLLNELQKDRRLIQVQNEKLAAMSKELSKVSELRAEVEGLHRLTIQLTRLHEPNNLTATSTRVATASANSRP